MNVESILDELRAQRTRLEQAIAALQGTARDGRSTNAGSMKHGHLSAASRARIGAAKKAWWARQKRKPSGTKRNLRIVKRSPMSSATRRKLSTLMKARWATRKKAA